MKSPLSKKNQWKSIKKVKLVTKVIPWLTEPKQGNVLLIMVGIKLLAMNVSQSLTAGKVIMLANTQMRTVTMTCAETVTSMK